MFSFSLSLSSQIEYIAGAKWNMEYNKWLVNSYEYYFGFRYHKLSKIKWQREIRKLPKHSDWDSISSHPNLTWDIIRHNPKCPWTWGYVSYNPNVTWDIIQENPDEDWNWHSISVNPNITWDISCESR